MSVGDGPLAGGRSTPGIIRVGETVRRPRSANAPFVHALLAQLERVGFRGAPRLLGVDAEDREMLSYLRGDVPRELGVFSADALRSGASLLRALHDATVEGPLRGDAEVVCHGDASPCNAVFLDGVPYAFIDFDAAHPGSRGEDLGHAAWLWTDLGNDQLSPAFQGPRLAHFASAYVGAPSAAPLSMVIAAQAELAERATASAATRRWARDCHAWTVAHRAALERVAAPATSAE